ncbi:Uncharacterized protein PBTT_03194 [Plasmodiophora brassicae]|uniref:Uncharacterized protein n=1 Tax=Plasmodiophora brassicae TaxID=37360 RepID=A0A0G4INF5_PLABS|nr:hypothetical protein PBRA_005311 [Plasmodiophora brassicae]SPQ95372.1 unnamed protein product [Plasmodiophora brassicae]
MAELAKEISALYAEIRSLNTEGHQGASEKGFPAAHQDCEHVAIQKLKLSYDERFRRVEERLTQLEGRAGDKSQVDDVLQELERRISTRFRELAAYSTAIRDVVRDEIQRLENDIRCREKTTRAISSEVQEYTARKIDQEMADHDQRLVTLDQEVRQLKTRFIDVLRCFNGRHHG